MIWDDFIRVAERLPLYFDVINAVGLVCSAARATGRFMVWWQQKCPSFYIAWPRAFCWEAVYAQSDMIQVWCYLSTAYTGLEDFRFFQNFWRRMRVQLIQVAHSSDTHYRLRRMHVEEVRRHMSTRPRV